MIKTLAVMLAIRLLMATCFLQTPQDDDAYLRKKKRTVSGAASSHTFTHVGETSGTACGASANSCSVTRTVTSGRLIILDSITAVSNSGISITGMTCGDPADGATAAVPTTHSFYTTLTNSDTFGFGTFYIISTAASGSTVFTCNYTTSPANDENFSAVSVFEFSYTGTGSVVFDKDALATFPSGTGSSPYTTPCISPTKTGSLLFANMVNDIGSMTGAGTPWTYISVTGNEAYKLSSSAGSTCANFTDSSSTDSSGVLLAAFN